MNRESQFYPDEIKSAPLAQNRGFFPSISAAPGLFLCLILLLSPPWSRRRRPAHSLERAPASAEHPHPGSLRALVDPTSLPQSNPCVAASTGSWTPLPFHDQARTPHRADAPPHRPHPRQAHREDAVGSRPASSAGQSAPSRAPRRIWYDCPGPGLSVREERCGRWWCPLG
jgi:hypothetical protein